MSDMTDGLKWLKAVTIACALIYALSALAILATTTTPPRTASDPAAAPPAQRLLGR